jgi:Mlc titration factor MtfA (ptsG expression regulator)
MIYSPRKTRIARLMAVLISLGFVLLTGGILVIPVFYLPTMRTRYLTILGGIELGLFVITYIILMRKRWRRRMISKKPVPSSWDGILGRRVSYYSALSREKRERFRKECFVFLNEVTITGIETEVTEEDRLLIAASAVIPIFSFPDWEYDRMSEVLLYPSNFNSDYDFDNKSNNILGLVTNGGSTMVLSKASLRDGFRDDKDKSNVGIHEFIHKVDGEDGSIDGVPALLMDSEMTSEWLSIIKTEAEKIRERKSDIRPYALTNNAEFFAVVSEYFFEHPMQMQKEHPELYSILVRIFKQDTVSLLKSVVRSMFRPYGKKIGRNSPCPCGSGKKYKKCCLDKKRYS